MVSSKEQVMSRRDKINYIRDNYAILGGFILIVVFLSIFAPNFLSLSNFSIILRQVSCIGIATIGVGILIIMNCNDLSIGSMFALCGVTAGLTISNAVGGMGLPPILGYIVGISTGIFFGFVNGILVAKGKINAFVITMGTQSIARGLALILAHGMPVGNFPESFHYLGTASLDKGNLIPLTVIIFFAVILVMNFVMNKLTIGRYVYAIGGNEEAARVAGINIDRVKLKVYLIEGALLGLAGTLMASRLKSAAPAMGVGYELDAIAGSIIGGVSFSGGIGKVWGMVLGTVIIGVINNGMDLLGVQAYYKQIVKGSIIIIAVLIDRKRSGRK